MRKGDFKTLKLIRRLTLALCISIGMLGLVMGLFLMPKKNPLKKPTTVAGYDISMYDEETLKSMLKIDYAWQMEIKDDLIDVTFGDPITEKIDETVDMAYSSTTQMDYEIYLTKDEIDEVVELALASTAISLDELGYNDDVISYDAETDNFVFKDVIVGPVIDQDQLEKDLRTALEEKNYTATITPVYLREPQVTDASQYQMIGSYETEAVENSNRDVNITLACQTVNGTILQPGESFSYNEKLGPRTAEKGYKQAGAYFDGQHVLQYGGGICQLSSTLYNAIFAAGFNYDDRKGHTFEPTYVRPGLDATVSYGGPDFSFTNTSDYPIGIRAHFENHIVSVEVYGVPILEDGVTRYMDSEKVATLPAPATIYQDNSTLAYGQEVVVKNGYGGSKWATYEVLEKDGVEESREFLYYTSYKGEAAVVQRNSIYY